MTLDKTRQRILTDDVFVMSEFRQLQEIFKMKRVIRYHQVRQEEVATESVAEHVYGMSALADYFLPLEEQGSWNYARIQQIALYHDIDEILTGDRIGYLKTADDRAKELEAEYEVLKRLPALTRQFAASCLEEYRRQETIEARFVKAIDKIEPLFHLINDNGKGICKHIKATYEQSRSIKDKYVADFPYMKRFNDVLNVFMLENGFFASEA